MQSSWNPAKLFANERERQKSTPLKRPENHLNDKSSSSPGYDSFVDETSPPTPQSSHDQQNPDLSPLGRGKSADDSWGNHFQDDAKETVTSSWSTNSDAVNDSGASAFTGFDVR